MASKDCKVKSFFSVTVISPLQNRFGVDQVPFELNEEPLTFCTFEDLKNILKNQRQQFKYVYG